MDSLHHIFTWYPIILFSLARLQLTSPELKAIAKCYRLYPQIRLAAKKFWSALGGQFIIYYKWKAKFIMTNCTSHIFSCLYMSYIHMHWVGWSYCQSISKLSGYQHALICMCLEDGTYMFLRLEGLKTQSLWSIARRMPHFCHKIIWTVCICKELVIPSIIIAC